MNSEEINIAYSSSPKTKSLPLMAAAITSASFHEDWGKPRKTKPTKTPKSVKTKAGRKKNKAAKAMRKKQKR